MTVFNDRFANHAVFTRLGNLRTQIEAAEEHLATTDLQEQHVRLTQVADYIERVLASADPTLVPEGHLDSLNTSVHNCAMEVEAFVAQKQPHHLEHANTHADSVLQQVAGLNVPGVPADVEGLREDVSRFRRSAGQHLGNLEKDIAAVKKALDQKVEKAQQNISQTTSQIAAKLNEVESTRQAIETSKQQFQGQFSEAQDRRSKEFTESAGERTKEFQALIKESRDTLGDELTALTEKAGSISRSSSYDGPRSRSSSARSVLTHSPADSIRPPPRKRRPPTHGAGSAL